MRIAEILSDLTSLRVCDHEAAMALVSSHKTLDEDQSLPVMSTDRAADPSNPPIQRVHRPLGKKKASGFEGVEGDSDLQRALDLVELHYGVKEKHMRGVDKGLQKARLEVSAVLERMNAGHTHGPRKR